MAQKAPRHPIEPSDRFAKSDPQVDDDIYGLGNLNGLPRGSSSTSQQESTLLPTPSVTCSRREESAETSILGTLQLQPSSTTYCYEPLDLQNNEIRLLTLLPGDFSDDIHVGLRNIPFDPDHPPYYEALSYAWGSAADPVSLEVGESGTISITQNLAVALPYLRHKDRSRILWIDAICVNQSDLAERSQQVQQMANIYKLAARVIAWVGTEADGSSLALKTIEDVGRHIDVDWDDWSITPKDNGWADWADVTVYTPLNEIEIFAVIAFIMRPWFERLWVQQEIRLASSSDAILACGFAHAAWEPFRRFMFALDKKQPPSFQLKSELEGEAYQDRTRLIELLCRPLYRQALYTRIQFAGNTKCSDPRDRVYAMLSIHEQTNLRLELTPDYSLPVAQVYQGATLEVLNVSADVNILSNCELRSNSKYRMPSWVPDFSTTRLNRSDTVCGAAGLSTALWECLPGDVLRVRGTPVGRLQDVQGISLRNGSCNEISDEIRRLRPSTHLESPYAGSGNVLDAYCEALFCGDFAERSVPPNRSLSHDSSKKILQTVWETKADWDLFKIKPTGNDFLNSTVNDEFFSMILSNCQYRTFCTTEQGLIGLAPTAALPGDLVCVLLGCDTCILLRQTDDERWQVVGDCYLPGLMAGEALAGPLPRQYRSVRSLDQDSRDWSWGFQNISTSKIQREDPRFDLSDYPEVDSEIETVERNMLTNELERFTNVIDDEESRLEYPWQEENIRKRGIQLKDFDLL